MSQASGVLTHRVRHFSQHVCDEKIEWGRVQQHVVRHPGAIAQHDFVRIGVHPVYRGVEPELILHRRLHPLEQSPGSAKPWILERVVRTPAWIVAIEKHVAEHTVKRRGRHALTDPFLVHHVRGMCPDFEVVRHHEVFGDAGAELSMNQLFKVCHLRHIDAGSLRLDQP